MIKAITKYNNHNCLINFDNNLKTTVTQEPIGSCVTVITNTHLRMPLNCEVINNWKWKCMWVCNSKKTWRLYVPISSISNYLHNFEICAWSKANLRSYLAVICQFKVPIRSSSTSSTYRYICYTNKETWPKLYSMQINSQLHMPFVSFIIWQISWLSFGS